LRGIFQLKESAVTKSEIIIVSVPVADQARAKAFYADKLGFTVTMEAQDAMGPGKSWITLKPTGGGVSLTLVNWFESMPAGSLRGLVVATADLEGEHARLKARGVSIDDINDAPWGRYATFRDSEGNGLVLQSFSATRAEERLSNRSRLEIIEGHLNSAQSRRMTHGCAGDPFVHRARSC
jgi:predicted enzyme related to lactoylglutathione lyase